MDRKKILLISLVTITVIIIILMLTIIYLNKEQSQKYYPGIDKIVETDGAYQYIEKLSKVDNRTDYYTIKGIIDEYFTYIRNIAINPLKYKTKISEEEKEEGMKLQKETSQNSIKAFLADKYLEEYPLTDENFDIIIEKFGNKSIIINKMLYIESSDTNMDLFIVNLSLIETNEEFYMMVRRDKNNYTFEIYLDDYIRKYKYDKKEEGESFEFDTSEIANKTYNVYTNKTVTDAEIADTYFLKYKYTVLKDTRLAYELLDEEYRNIRFGSFENYDKYIQDNITDMKNIVASEYLMNNYDEYTEYVCKDQYGNYYKFRAKGIMEYTLQLDTYTILTDKFKKTYDEASNKEKVAMQIDKLLEMINNRDYRTIYKKLDDNFKNNYFNTEEKFSEYMKRNYDTHYTLDYGDFSQKGNVYIQKIYLKSIDEDENAIGIETEIYMQLEDNRDFRISFGVIKK